MQFILCILSNPGVMRNTFGGKMRPAERCVIDMQSLGVQNLDEICPGVERVYVDDGFKQSSLLPIKGIRKEWLPVSNVTSVQDLAFLCRQKIVEGKTMLILREEAAVRVFPYLVGSLSHHAKRALMSCTLLEVGLQSDHVHGLHRKAPLVTKTMAPK